MSISCKKRGGKKVLRSKGAAKEIYLSKKSVQNHILILHRAESTEVQAESTEVQTDVNCDPVSILRGLPLMK